MKGSGGARSTPSLLRRRVGLLFALIAKSVVEIRHFYLASTPSEASPVCSRDHYLT